jgi:hypothetical protein
MYAKSSKLSIEHREKGNESYKKREFIDALVSYNKVSDKRFDDRSRMIKIIFTGAGICRIKRGVKSGLCKSKCCLFGDEEV